MVPTVLISCNNPENEPKNEYKDLEEIGVYEDCQPAQEVAYNHSLHAGKLEMDCRYCHTAPSSAEAASKSVDLNVCKACHLFDADKDLNAQDITTHDWSKLHTEELPEILKSKDSVMFSHKVHVQQAGIDCKSCHGHQENGVEKFALDLCIECHK